MINKHLKDCFWLLGIAATFSVAATSCKPKTNESHDLLLTSMDTTVNPADDFFMYANGLWIKNNPIPAAYSSWSIANLVDNEIQDRLRTINEQAEKEGGKAGSNVQKIGDFWYSGMDTVAINKAGISPLKSDLNKIASIKTADDVLSVIAYMHTLGNDPLFGVMPSQDQKNSNLMRLYLWQGGIGLPQRDYYFSNDKHSVEVRNYYKSNYLPNMYKFTGMGDKAAKEAAQNVYKLEEQLAKASRTLADLRDPYANYNAMSIADLNKLTPGINWSNLFKSMEVKVDTVVVGQPEFFKQVAASLKSTPIDTWKAYLTIDLLRNNASYLSKDIDDEQFKFYGEVLSGRKEQLPRWKRVLNSEEYALGEVLGQQYVKEFFSEEGKTRYETMVENVKTAFGERVKKLDWMSATTKAKALDKLKKVTQKVGYPNKWKDLSALTINRGPYVLNMQRASQFWYKYEMAKLGKPVDRTEWEMTPQTYNAYYNPSNNEIVLPAAIFTLPGWNDKDIDDAIAYGYVGASTIGHELTHGFDDQGSQYDAQGNLVKWWTPVDEKNFKQRTQRIVDQFNGYVVLDSLHINGEATQGENIADLGGLVTAWDAFVKTQQYKEGKTINGLTPAQRFFLGYALGWMSHQRDKSLANQIMTDVHSPARQRVNGPMSNINEFYKAFNVKPGNKMYVPDSLRVRIW